MTVVCLGEMTLPTLAWKRWFDEAADDYDAACLEIARLMRQDAPDMAAITRFWPYLRLVVARFEARLTAYNAYMEYRATH